jgi:peptide/nickel transport system substrate-binding protein
MRTGQPSRALTAGLALLLVLSFVVAGCGAPAPSPTAVPPTVAPTKAAAAPTSAPAVAPTAAPAAPTKAAAPKVLRIINGEPNTGLDPSIAATVLSQSVMELMHDPLVERDKDWKAIPWIAESWKANADFTEWTFVLKKGVKFSDGSPLTADDVKFSFERMAAAALWKARLTAIKSITVKDPLNIVFAMSKPLPEFLEMPASNFSYFIVSKAACEKGCDFSKPGTPVSGPWVLKEWTVKSQLILEKNPNYHVAGLPKFDRIEYKFSDDRVAMAQAVVAGTADIMYPVNAPDAATWLKSPDVKLYQGFTMAQTRGWGFDKQVPPFNDKRVRQAIGWVVEPDLINKTCWFDLATPLYGGVFFAADKDWGFLARNQWQKPRAERLVLANQLLTDAGWVDSNKDGIRESKGIAGIADGTQLAVTVAYERPWVQAECQTLLLQQWLKEVGFKLTPDGREKATYWPDVAARKFQMWHLGNSAGPIAWERLRDFFSLTGASASYLWPDSKEADAMVTAILAEPDLTKRKALMSTMVDWLADQQLIVATGSQDVLVLTNAKMTGFYPLWNGSWRSLVYADIPGR